MRVPCSPGADPRFGPGTGAPWADVRCAPPAAQAADGPYYWLLHALGIYKPVTWEYSRLNITYNVLSKRRSRPPARPRPSVGEAAGRAVRRFLRAPLFRFCNAGGCALTGPCRLNTLVMKGHVRGWDDPRLLTLDGLRRRGYTPTAINAFCEQVASRAGGGRGGGAISAFLGF